MFGEKNHFLCKDLVRNHSIDSQTFINGWPSDHPTLAFPTFAGWSASAKGALVGKFVREENPKRPRLNGFDISSQQPGTSAYKRDLFWEGEDVK